MSYESRSRCKERQITHCGICPLMFKCPYDEDKDKYNNYKSEAYENNKISSRTH